MAKAIFTTPWQIKIPGKESYLIYPPDELPAAVAPYAKRIGMSIAALREYGIGMIKGDFATDNDDVIAILANLNGTIIRPLQLPGEIKKPDIKVDKEMTDGVGGKNYLAPADPKNVPWELMDIDRLQAFCGEHGLVCPDRRIKIDKQRKFVKSQWAKRLKAKEGSK